MEQITLAELLGSGADDQFDTFDVTEIQEVMAALRNTDPVDLAHAELLAQQCLRCADILSEYLGKLTKTTSYLESRHSYSKNKASLDYEAPAGRTTAEMKKWAGEVSPDVEAVALKLAKAKGSKVALEKKYDIVIKAHHHFKDIASGMRKSILNYRDG